MFSVLRHLEALRFTPCAALAAVASATSHLELEEAAASGFPLVAGIFARSQRVIFRQKSHCCLCCWQKLLQHYVNIVGLFPVSLCTSFSIFADAT